MTTNWEAIRTAEMESVFTAILRAVEPELFVSMNIAVYNFNGVRVEVEWFDGSPNIRDWSTPEQRER